jgi:hypothetical protein
VNIETSVGGDGESVPVGKHLVVSDLRCIEKHLAVSDTRYIEKYLTVNDLGVQQTLVLRD